MAGRHHACPTRAPAASPAAIARNGPPARRFSRPRPRKRFSPRGRCSTGVRARPPRRETDWHVRTPPGAAHTRARAAAGAGVLFDVGIPLETSGFAAGRGRDARYDRGCDSECLQADSGSRRGRRAVRRAGVRAGAEERCAGRRPDGRHRPVRGVHRAAPAGHGTRGESGVRRTITGSVASGVAWQSACSVPRVPPGFAKTNGAGRTARATPSRRGGPA